jgi:hypothetical protein
MMLASEQNPVLQDDPLVGGSVPRPKEVSPGLSAALWTEVMGLPERISSATRCSRRRLAGLSPPNTCSCMR